MFPANAMSDARLGSLFGPPDQAPLPLIIGVTGHRDIRPEDLVFLEGMVRATLVDIHQSYKHCQLVLLSPLAEGGDRLVARVAVEMGAKLVVPLPLPLELYEQDFEGQESRAEFHELLAGAQGRIDMPLVEGNTVEGIRTYGPERDRQYAMVGAFIARHSQVFLALWDGRQPEPGSKVGGTAEIVRFRLEGAPVPFDPPRSPLTFASSGPVYHIVTPRLQDPTVEGRAFTRQNLVPTHRTEGSFHRLFEHMDRFNEDAKSQVEGLPEKVKESQAQLLQAKVASLPHVIAELPHAARRVLDQYAVADALAVHFGQKTLGASFRLFRWVFVAALSFNLFHSFPHVEVGQLAAVSERLRTMPWFLVLFVLLFVYCSAVLHRRAAKGDYQNKYQDYRALAEGLRIQFFWTVAGVRDSVVDHYLRKQRGELEWIRSALRAWDLLARTDVGDANRPGPAQGERLHFVRKHWVLEQRNYFASKARREQAALEADEHKVEALLRIALGLTLVFAVVLILPMFVHAEIVEEINHFFEGPAVHGGVMLLIVMSLVAAGLLHGYNQQLARSEHAKQYSRMSELFDVAEHRLSELLTADRHTEAEELLKELGEEALEENADWVLLHRERPLEVPHAG